GAEARSALRRLPEHLREPALDDRPDHGRRRRLPEPVHELHLEVAGRSREGLAGRPARRRQADRRAAPARGWKRPAVRDFFFRPKGGAMIRRLATAAVAVIALAFAAGVAGAVTNSAKKPTGITIWVGWSKSTHEFGVFKSLIAEYNRKTPS